LHGDSFRLKKNPRPLSERIPVKLLKNAPRIVPAKTVPDCEGDPAKASYLNNTLSKRFGPLPDDISAVKILVPENLHRSSSAWN
jgi:hypothetical protein